MPSVIYIVATPIGNLDDLTPRAKATLEHVDVVAAEDTRTARRLLTHLGVKGKRLVSYQDHGEAERAEALVQDLLASEQSLAVVTDAGTPCISDPGYRIVAAAKAKGLKVHPVPGVSALTTLVSASGLPSDRLLFIGFLPTKASQLAAELASWRSLRASVVFFEATRRLPRTLAQVAAAYPDARVAVGRELTKLYEEIVTLPVLDALEWSGAHQSLKGEATVMVSLGLAKKATHIDATRTDSAGPDAPVTAAELEKLAEAEFQAGASLKDLLRKYKDFGLKRGELYDLLLRARGRGE